MIGVTVAVGTLYAKSSEIAAACLKQCTGLDTIILSSSQFSKSGLQHPAALKLRLFDLVPDEDILYYDADWFCVNPWHPEQFSGHPRIVACRDFVLTRDWPEEEYDQNLVEFSGSPHQLFIDAIEGEIRRDYVDAIVQFNHLGIPPARWINTGMFIANRTHHHVWLKEAEVIYTKPQGHHGKYFEQPAMMKAMERLNLRADLLPRKFNVLVNSCKRWPTSTIAVHVKLSKAPQFGALITELVRGKATPDLIRRTFLLPSDLNLSR